MTLNPDFSFFMFQAIFDRRQNLTFDIGTFLKNPNLLVIPKSRCTVGPERLAFFRLSVRLRFSSFGYGSVTGC